MYTSLHYLVKLKMLKEVTSKIYPTSTVASKFARFKHRGLH